MKTLLSLSFFWVILSNSVAQTMQTSVYLVNGEVVEGTLVEYLQGSRLIIEQKNGKSTIIDVVDIKRIVQEEYAEKQQKKPGIKARAYSFREKGIYNITYFSSLNGEQEGRFNTGLGISNILGYQLSRSFGIGLGTGITTYSLENGETIIPLFVETRGYLKREKIAPYYSFSLGYGFPTKNGKANIIDVEGGLLGEACLGLRLGAEKNSNVLIDLGYHTQRATYIRTVQFEELEETTINFNRIVARVGLIF
jgi:hypothetical protein